MTLQPVPVGYSWSAYWGRAVGFLVAFRLDLHHEHDSVLPAFLADHHLSAAFSADCFPVGDQFPVTSDGPRSFVEACLYSIAYGDAFLELGFNLTRDACGGGGDDDDGGGSGGGGGSGDNGGGGFIHKTGRRKMSGGLVKSGRTKRALFKTSSIYDYLNVFNETSSIVLCKQQYTRSFYSKFPLLFRKFKDTAISTPSLYSSSSSASSTSSSVLSWFVENGFVGWYLGMIKSHPVLTKSVTSASIYTAADFTSQRLTATSSESYDLYRTLRMTGYGLLIAGPSMHIWFNSMSKVLPKRDVLTTLKKIFVGQALYGPIMTAVFFSSNAGLQGENGIEIVARLRRDLLPTLKNGLLYWPVCDFITFKFIPVPLQPLISNSFAYLWTIYITYMASLKKVDRGKIAID
ncbi:hypothetical protein IFM89_016738 [Coptis chinensis]|uniref:Uncharacterized protein n=1 Tax=Coptis chinensis TaxID=261450 RepID=A0A835IPR3_9MAGN|nr:hypothetical protein IFM89_016738 [Coptis chinensis]